MRAGVYRTKGSCLDINTYLGINETDQTVDATEKVLDLYFFVDLGLGLGYDVGRAVW
jgi:hypothetical protein